jgi:hypothetical protein
MFWTEDPEAGVQLVFGSCGFLNETIEMIWQDGMKAPHSGAFCRFTIFVD